MKLQNGHASYARRWLYIALIGSTSCYRLMTMLLDESRKSVLWISYPFPPAVSAGVFRSARFVKYLREFGWTPFVFTLKMDKKIAVDPTLTDLIPEGIEIESAHIWRPDQWKNLLWGKQRKENQASRKESVRLSLLPNNGHASVNPSAIKRCYRDLRERLLATPDPKIWWAIPSFWQAYRYLRQHRPSVIFSTSPPNSSHLLGLWLKRWSGLPLVLDFRDPWTRSPWVKPQSKYLAAVHRRLERSCVEAADAIILNTTNAREEFIDFYGPQYADKFHTVYNGYDPELLEHAQMLQESYQNPAGKEPLKLCHIGTIYGRREIRPLLRAIAQVVSSGQNIEFEHVGIVNVDYDLDEFIRRNELARHVTISAPVAHEEALARMATADALLLIQPDGYLQVPGKLFEMILFSKPILSLTGEGTTRDIAEQYNLGPLADPADEQSIVKALEALCQPSAAMPVKWDAVRSRFNGRNQTAELARIFHDVCH